MIQVTVFRKKDFISAFKISGHAMSGPYGYDLVCAGVSAVSFGAVNALIKVAKIEPDVEQAGEGGFLSIGIPSNTVQNNTVQTILKTMIVSLESIEQEYKDFIQIKWN